MELTKEQESKVEEKLSPVDEDSYYDEWLDETFGDVYIAGNAYSTSDALSAVSVTDYRAGKSDCFSDDRVIQDIGGDYYKVSEIEKIIDEIDEEIEEER